ncbi:MAG: FMN-binding protein, partial [Ruminococcus sp.]|nr:FMN-binding protein [Ruminococcus sp.]
YKYRNGEYEAEAEGYAGKVHVKLSIENDSITSISAWADDDDPEYFNDAMNTVIPQIGAKVSADGIDACSGATYSSNGIVDAARKALEQAMN